MALLSSGDLTTLLSAFSDEWFNLDQQAQAISIALYRLLARGYPVSEDMLCGETALPAAYVRQYLREANGIQCCGDGCVAGYWGLALQETRHRFVIDGRTLFTWCAWDSLFIPGITGLSAQIESVCPVTGKAIQLSVSPTSVESTQPSGVMQSFIRPDPSAIREDVRSSFCQYVHFFNSPSSGEEWVAEHEGTVLLSLEEAFRLGQMKNARQYGSALTG